MLFISGIRVSIPGFPGRMLVQTRKSRRLVKPGVRSEPAPKDARRAEPMGEDLFWMTAPIYDESTAWIMEYTWSPSDLPEPAVRPKLRRGK
jgi:hypothetical protein